MDRNYNHVVVWLNRLAFKVFGFWFRRLDAIRFAIYLIFTPCLIYAAHYLVTHGTNESDMGFFLGIMVYLYVGLNRLSLLLARVNQVLRFNLELLKIQELKMKFQKRQFERQKENEDS